MEASAVGTVRDEGWGGVWPAAILVGASSAACLAAGAWVGSPSPSVHFLPFVAEHALWGSAFGAAVTLALRLGSSRNPALELAALRRTVAVRATPAAVTLAVLLALGFLGDSSRAALAAGLGAALGGAVWLGGLRLWLRYRNLAEIPRLDSARVAALVAVLTLPLAIERAGAVSLLEAWRSCLAP